MCVYKGKLSASPMALEDWARASEYFVLKLK